MSGETRDLGKLMLEVGILSVAVTVTAEVTPVRQKRFGRSQSPRRFCPLVADTYGRLALVDDRAHGHRGLVASQGRGLAGATPYLVAASSAFAVAGVLMLYGAKYAIRAAVLELMR